METFKGNQELLFLPRTFCVIRPNPPPSRNNRAQSSIINKFSKYRPTPPSQIHFTDLLVGIRLTSPSRNTSAVKIIDSTIYCNFELIVDFTSNAESVLYLKRHVVVATASNLLIYPKLERGSHYPKVWATVV